MTNRPDYSEYVAHFTSAVAIQDAALNQQIGSMGALERLANILSEQRIRATKKYYALGPWSVAFTECPWTSLLDHATQYSAYAVGFTKQLLWEKGGQPAVYLRSAVLKSIKAHVEEKAGGPVGQAIAPAFGALYTPIEREPGWEMLSESQVDTHVDYAHEREWRVVGDFDFNYQDVQFLIVNQFADIEQLPAAAVNAIGQDRILSMSNYRRIVDLWPMY